MENLASPELMLTIVGGGVVTILVNLLKKPLKKYSPRLVVAVLSLLTSLLYFSFYTYVPDILRQEIVDFVYGILSSAVFIYAFIWKGLKKKGSEK